LCGAVKRLSRSLSDIQEGGSWFWSLLVGLESAHNPRKRSQVWKPP
jgi:hypothetical protein